MKKHSAFLFFLAVCLLLLNSCTYAKPIGLALMGYNYTDQKLAWFSVTDEKGTSVNGGPVTLSSPTSGGGGGVCCVMLNPKTTKPTRLQIRWAIDSVTDANGHVVTPEVEKNAWVTVSPPFPADPGYFEVHFYPDGHVEVAVTQYISEPRLKFPRNIEG
ncbi:hypothetical protein JOE11_005566 [Robbsia andropogonis]|uniref:DUF3304 domain-containing protein n=1 Tax=Robbsia andropogonis TaxID=28092 RepID=UPI003D22EA3C